MILIDTNVISELMKMNPSFQVINWFNNVDANYLYLSNITIAEIHYELQVLPQGKRRSTLETAFENAISEAFQNRILSFDDITADYYSRIMGRCKLQGHPLGILDGQIAAIASAQKFSLATRNIKDFKHCGLELINPFS